MLNHEITIEEKEAALFKILSHPSISESTSLRNYLEFVGEEVIRGRAEHLGEYEIGTKVFHKPPEFDPRVDPVVRTHARRLRRRLAHYYHRDGRKDLVRLDVPRGTYLPQFVRQQSRFVIPLPLVLWVVLLVGLVGVGWVARKIYQVYGHGLGLSRQEDLPCTLLLLPFANSPKTTLLVLSSDYFLKDKDGNLLRIRPEIKADLPRKPLANPGELLVTPSLRQTAPLSVDGGYTGSGEAACAALVTDYLVRRGKRVEVRLAELGRAVDYGASNVIFVGAPPPGQLPHKGGALLDFRLTEQPQPDGSLLPVIRNANVGPGERAEYPAARHVASKALEVVHSLLSVMPGDEHEVTFLVIGSQSSAGVRSACDYLLSGRADGDLPAVWRSSEFPPLVIEMLLRTPIHDLEPARAEYVAHHYRERN